MKRFSVLPIFMLVILVCATACSSKSEQLDWIQQIDAEETYPEVPGSLAVVYENIADIMEDASVIAKCSVIEQSVVMLDGYPQTHTTVNVKNVIKGTVSEGDALEVVEEGGRDGKVLGGIPQLSSDFDYYLMLTEYKGVYYICGAFQGRFIEREGYVFQQATEDVKLSRSYTPVTSADFESLADSCLMEDS